MRIYGLAPVTLPHRMPAHEPAMNCLQRRMWLRRMALAAAAIVLCVTSLSAYLRLSHAGLGCSEWPRCYGARLRVAQQDAATAIPQEAAVAVARSAHRVLAVAALVAMAFMTLLCFGGRPRFRREGALALALVALAIGLAVLGRWSAGARIPAIAIGNLLGGMVMLALCWRLALPAADRKASAPRWTSAVVVLLLAQTALGALVSASYAGLACTSLADCWRTAEAAGFPWHALDPWREPAVAADALNADGALAQFLHRAASPVVALATAILGIAALRGGRRRTGAALLALVALQLGLGMLLVAALLPLPLALAHNVVAALLLAAAAGLA